MLHCPFCDFTTEMLPKMSQHVQAKHNASACPVCGVAFKYTPLHFREMARFDPLHATLYYLYGMRVNRSRKKYVAVAEWVLSNKRFGFRRFQVDGGLAVETEFALILFPQRTRNTAIPRDVAAAMMKRIGEGTSILSIVDMAREEYGIEGLETPHARMLKLLALSRF